MIKKLAICMLGLVAATSFTGCNSDSSYIQETTYSSTIVKTFKIKANEKILSNLDSVFFSIDLVNGQIFNADSLPYGTNVSRLIVQLTTDPCSKLEMTVPMRNGRDTIINYYTNSTDSIDFSNGPVKLHIVSYNGEHEQDYTINVNVHRVVPDSLCWSINARRPLPGNLSAPTAQKAVRMGSKAVSMVQNGSENVISYTENPNGEWTSLTPRMTFTPQVSSLNATDDALFILADNGDLYTSDDLGATWRAAGANWTSIIGNYGNKLVGVKKVDGRFVHASFPASTEKEVAGVFPVSGTSLPVAISSDWSEQPQIITAGGCTADGKATDGVWGFDGQSWARIGRLPFKGQGISLIPYTVATVDTIRWQVTSRQVLLAYGGFDGQTVNNNVYISRDNGVNWKLGDTLLQMPKYISPRYDAQALVFDHTFTSAGRSEAADWEYEELMPLPRWWALWMPHSRSLGPVEEWQCPYIYLFGGYNASGMLFNTVWRGVINRLMFKPLQ